MTCHHEAGCTGGGEGFRGPPLSSGAEASAVAEVVVDVDTCSSAAASMAGQRCWPEGEGRPSTGCRICHLGDGEVPAESGSGRLVRLGCGCCGELAAAHRRCAEAWFSVRGNRRCEICGENAENITGWGGGGKEFIQLWHATAGTDAGDGSSKACGGFCKSQSFCNLFDCMLDHCIRLAMVPP